MSEIKSKRDEGAFAFYEPLTSKLPAAGRGQPRKARACEYNTEIKSKARACEYNTEIKSKRAHFLGGVFSWTFGLIS